MCGARNLKNPHTLRTYWRRSIEIKGFFLEPLHWVALVDQRASLSPLNALEVTELFKYRIVMNNHLYTYYYLLFL